MKPGVGVGEVHNAPDWDNEQSGLKPFIALHEAIVNLLRGSRHSLNGSVRHKPHYNLRSVSVVRRRGLTQLDFSGHVGHISIGSVW
jgi:hypothetical protein